MDLQDLLAALRARWILIVTTTVDGGLVALVVGLMTPPVYQAKVQFYVTVSGGDTAAAAYQGSLGAQQRALSYVALVKSTEVTQAVVTKTGANLTPAQLASKATGAADSKTVVLTISVSDSEPERAQLLAEGYGTVLPQIIKRLETPEGGGPILAKLSVVNQPSLPNSPVSPKPLQNIAIGLALGLLLGVGTALLINSLDRRIKSKHQVEDLAHKPVVGMIPFRRTEDKEFGTEHLVPFRKGHSPVAEAFRRLRTNLQFLNVDKPPKMFVVTSAVAAEGKSETALNLSLALAESGNRILLVEADFRRPRIAHYMGMPDTVGLTNAISGQVEFDDVVQRTRLEGLDLLACGPIPPNPSELLSSKTAKKLLETFRDRYDYVVIDSPPLLPVTDGALLAQITDGALLVVRAQRTTADQLGQAVDNLAKADATLLGLVMVANKPTAKRSAKYYDSYLPSSTTTPAAKKG